MNMIKSISKRTLALILSLLMLLSSGIVGTLAANVDLAPVGANTVAGGYIYFDNTKTQWTDSCIQFVIGHSSFSRTYTMSKITNTNLYYVNLSSSTYHDWSDATYYAVIGTSSKWGDGNWGSSNLTNATHRTAAFTTAYSLDGDTKRFLVTPSSASNGTSISIAYKGTAYSSLNSAQTVYARSAESGGSTYSNDANAGTVKVEGYYLSANSTAASRSAATTSGSTYTTNALLAAGTTVKLTATVNDGYTFKGWYNSSGTQVGTELNYSYAHSGSAASYFARYEKVETKVTATFNDWNGNELYEVEIDKNTTPTYGGSTPTRTGYTFAGWSPALGPISGDTTYTAQYTPITYTITYNNYDGTLLGKGSAKYDTNVNVFNNAPSNPTRPSTETTDYTFATWVYENGNSVGANDKITGDLTLKASYTESARSYTVNFSNPDGGTVAVTANGASVANGGSVEYGTVLTLTATPDKFYTVGTWTANGAAVDGTTYTVTGDVTLAHTFAVKPSSVITFNYDNTLGSLGMTGGTGDIETVTAQKAYRVEKDGTLKVTISIKQGVEGYYIKQIGTTSYEGQYDNSSVTNYTVTATDTDQTIAIDIAEIPSKTVTTVVNPDGKGTVTGGGKVYEGSSCILNATPAEGYTFVNWTYTPAGAINEAHVNLSAPAIQFVPQEDVIFTANFAASKGTVNVSAAEGGTVNTEGGDITYPETVTATATADTSNGYLFTHWTVKAQCKDGTDAKEDTDYAIVSENNNVIEIRILTNGTVVDVVANFANAQKIKVYTYSDSGFTSLKITESNGTETLTPYDGGQDPITFGKKTWYTPGEVTLTAGYYDEITAQMYGSNPLENGTGNLVIFNNTVGWSNVYLYTSTTTMWNPDLGGSTQDCTTKGLTAVQMQRIGSSNYYYAYVDSSIKYTLFLETENNNYDRVHNNKASYRGDYSSSKPMFTPNTTASSAASDATNNTTYYNNGSWAVAPTVPTTTNAVDITSALYNGAEWLGKEEVWLYFAANGTTVVATDRKELNGYVTSALIKSTYNNGKNDKGYTGTSWSAFTSAYTAAVNTLGTGASTQVQIDAAYTALDTAYKALALTTTVTITGSHGAMPGFGTYYGTISFPDDGVTVTKHTGNIGDSDSDDQTKQNCEYLKATVNRNQVITINTTVKDSDYMVLGWVVNGTEFISATQDLENTDLFIGTYTCSSNAVIVPLYFRDDTITKFNEGSKDIIKLYAKTDDSSTTWGNYMAAYTWTSSTYRQFGRWTGQLMIPDAANPGMYYTYVEKFNPEAPTEVITGITFNNYGNNTGIYTGQRYQAYDYYEFMELADQNFDNIVFELNESDGVSNWPSKSKLDLSNNNYNFYPFTDFSGNEVDITRTELTDEQKALDTALYIVRTGPCDPDTDGIGHGTADLSGSDYYVNAYVYDAEGNFLVACKTYELLNLDDLKTKRGVDLSIYAGKPVEVDYASLTDTSGNKRYDGEWFGTKYGFTKVDIEVQVAYIDDKGNVVYYSDRETPNNIDGVGSAYINGEAFVEVDHGSEGHLISAIVPDGNDFVGWYRATANGDGTYSIDVTATPLFVERSTTIDASADAVYIAVFKEHPEGAFTVNNYYYTYDDFKGQTMSPNKPPVFGGDTSYSIRDVEIDRIYNSYTKESNDVDKDRAGTYTQTLDSVNVGDILRITIYTKPTFPRDYVYAWYIQANDSYGINFEEIGTTATNPSGTLMQEESFTFEYEVEAGVSNITIYSDVVHTTDIVTLTYIYTNRFGIEQKYIVKHKLTQEELENEYQPLPSTIRAKAPKVDDLFKDLEWIVDKTQSDATNYTLRATENNLFDVIVNIGGEVFEYQKKFNEPMEIKAYELVDDLDRSKPGIWYLDTGNDGGFDEGEDTILGYGQYYGLVVTGDAYICYENDFDLVTQIVLADAVYGAEKVTDENGVETVNKVYVDYLISYLINVFSGQYIDLNGNEQQDENEPIVYEANNVSNPCSIEAIRNAGYTVDYGLVLELLNTFNAETKDQVLNDYYGTNLTLEDKITPMLANKKALEAAGDKDGLQNLKDRGWGDTGYANTHYFLYDAKDYGFEATNKNRVLMTFDYDNTDAMRSRYYNVMAYLVISDEDGNNPYYCYSNQATLNIQEADNITN